MAPLAKSLALAGSLLAAFGSAAPLNKRDANGNVHVVYETATTVVWTTVDLTTTIYANIPAPTAAAQTSVVSVTQAAPTVQTLEPQPAPEPTTEEAQPTQAPQPTTTQVEEPETTQPAVTSVAQPTYTPEPQPEPQQPTTTAVAQPTTAAAPQPAPTTGGSSSSSSSSGSSGSSGGGSWSSGDLTFYDTATSASAPSSCGFTNDGLTENVVALSHEIMQDSDCGKMITVEYNGKTETAKVVDKCMGCAADAIDGSRALFNSVASADLGRIVVKWRFN